MTTGIVPLPLSVARTYPEYLCWVGMKARCLNPKHKHYKNYGGRGITICDAWLSSFEQFVADVGRRPSKKHTIDRRDTNGNYEPFNVKWSTYAEQHANRRDNRLITIGDTTKCLTAWAQTVGMNPHTLRGRLERGYSPEEAINPERLKKHRCGSWRKKDTKAIRIANELVSRVAALRNNDRASVAANEKLSLYGVFHSDGCEHEDFIGIFDTQEHAEAVAITIRTLVNRFYDEEMRLPNRTETSVRAVTAGEYRVSSDAGYMLDKAYKLTETLDQIAGPLNP